MSCSVEVPALTQMSEHSDLRGHAHPAHILSFLTILLGPGIPVHFQDLPGVFFSRFILNYCTMNGVCGGGW